MWKTPMPNNGGLYELFSRAQNPIPVSRPICLRTDTATFTPIYITSAAAPPPRKPIIYGSIASTPIYPMHSTSEKTHVRFSPSQNKIIYINGKDFYQQNGIKQKIWWTPQELNFSRNMFMIEVRRLNDKLPHKTPRECISEIFERL